MSAAVREVDIAILEWSAREGMPPAPPDVEDAVAFTQIGSSWVTAVGGVTVVVRLCPRGWWLAEHAYSTAMASGAAVGLTRKDAVLDLAAGRLDGPCPGCTCGLGPGGGPL